MHSSTPSDEPIPELPPPPPDPDLRVPLIIEDWLTVLSLGTLAVITMANVIVRYMTDQSFAWNEEISIFRSEEHTSELQSLMRISYAVFCLKQKRNSKL